MKIKSLRERLNDFNQNYNLNNSIIPAILKSVLDKLRKRRPGQLLLQSIVDEVLTIENAFEIMNKATPYLKNWTF